MGMDADEHKWIEEAVELVQRADQKGVSIVLARYQDGNDEADLILTNVTDAPQLEDW